MTENSTTASDSILFFMQTFALTLFTTFSVFAILVYCLVLYIIFVYFREFRSNFYCYLVSLAVGDLGYLCLILFYAVPSTILKHRLWASDRFDRIAGFVESVCFFTQCVHLTFIAANRLAYAGLSASNSVRLDRYLQKPKAVAIWIMLMWLVIACLSVPQKLKGCQLTYDFVTFNFDYNCTRSTFPWALILGIEIDILDLIYGIFFPIIITVIHSMTWLVIYRQNRRSILNSELNYSEIRLNQRRQREQRIFVQLSLISVMFILWEISYWIIRFLSPADGAAAGGVPTLFGICSSAVNPFVYLIWNKTIQNKARRIIFAPFLKIQKFENVVVVVDNVGDKKRARKTIRRSNTAIF